MPESEKHNAASSNPGAVCACTGACRLLHACLEYGQALQQVLCLVEHIIVIQQLAGVTGFGVFNILLAGLFLLAAIFQVIGEIGLFQWLDVTIHAGDLYRL
jgi:hypothetical protein